MKKSQLNRLIKAWQELMEIDPLKTDPDDAKETWDRVTDELALLIGELDDA